MKLKKFLKKHSHNNLIRLYYKSKEGLVSVYPNIPNDVSMDHEIIKGKGIHKHFRNHKVKGLASIYHYGKNLQYSEAIDIVIEYKQNEPTAWQAHASTLEAKPIDLEDPIKINYDWLAAVTRSYDLHYKNVQEVYAKHMTTTIDKDTPTEREPWEFCETPEEKCTMNYCDDNGCQNRKREAVNIEECLKDAPGKIPREELLEDTPEAISTLEFAMDALKKAIKNDPYYRETWFANISMAFKDAYKECVLTNGCLSFTDSHKIATMAAENFLKQLEK